MVSMCKICARYQYAIQAKRTYEKVKVGNDPEKAQSEKDSHSKN